MLKLLWPKFTVCCIWILKKWTKVSNGAVKGTSFEALLRKIQTLFGPWIGLFLPDLLLCKISFLWGWSIVDANQNNTCGLTTVEITEHPSDIAIQENPEDVAQKETYDDEPEVMHSLYILARTCPFRLKPIMLMDMISWKIEALRQQTSCIIWTYSLENETWTNSLEHWIAEWDSGLLILEAEMARKIESNTWYAARSRFE